MQAYQKALLVDVSNGFYRMKHYPTGENLWGPIDLGLHLAVHWNSLNIGTGQLAGSIFPGSNRLFINGFSPCWAGFYISSMGGAGLIFENLGINMVSLIRKAPQPSVLILNRRGTEEVEVSVEPVSIRGIWKEGRGGVYSMMQYIYDRYRQRYENDPRILATGPASLATDFGAIASAPISKGEITYVDTWAGRGGFGSKMLQEHNIAGIIYGGTYVDEDFRDRKVADDWFKQKYNKKMMAKDLEATTKYRFEPKFQTGGTFGVNYTTLQGRIIAFNYQSMYWSEEERLELHQKFIVDHYLKQFNKETIEPKNQKHCGEPCPALCKKMKGEFKKDYEPYQTMGPLSGIFDQRAAEKLNHHADRYGFDAISAGGVVSWLMELLSKDIIKPSEAGVKEKPLFHMKGFSLEADSMHNAEIGVGILDAIIEKKGILDFSEGARKFARHLARSRGSAAKDSFIYNAFGRKGWMVPNQYWTPGVLSPMAIMGKYYMYYGNDYYAPRELGRQDAKRFKEELMLDNFGFCRFHRGWAEEMIPEIVENIWGKKESFLREIERTATRINSRNASVFWESERNADFVISFLKRKHEAEGENDKSLMKWLDAFKKDKTEAALNFWYEMHKGITESLREF